MMNVDQLCDRIVAWMRNAPPDYECEIGDPASDEDLSRLAKLLPTGLVPGPLESMLKRHNGLSATSTSLGGRNHGFVLQPIEEIIDSTEVFRKLNMEQLEWQDEPWVYRSVSGPVRPEYWNEGWIHFGGDGNYPVCMDMNPPARGVVGQIIEIDHEDSSIAVVANSLEEYLEGILRSLPSLPAGT